MKKILIICSVLVLFSGVSFSQSVLTMDDFIKSAIRNNPRYQISAREYLAALQKNKADHSIEDWNLIASGTYFDSYPATSNPLTPKYQNVLGYSIGTEKYFVASGTGLKIEHGNTRTRIEYPPEFAPTLSSLGFSTEPYYISNLSVTITQPLLKNAFGTATRKGLEISDFALKLAEYKLQEDWEDFIRSLRDEYLNWQECHLLVEVQEKKLNRIKAQLALLKRQYSYGLSEDIDIVQTRQQEAVYILMLEQSRMNCTGQLQKIIGLMGRKNAKTDGIIPEKVVKKDINFGEEQALQYLNSKSNVKRAADLVVDMQKKSLDISGDAELMDVNLIMRANPNAYENQFSDSISKIGEHNDYSVTVRASRGLFNDQAEANKKKAQEQYEKSKAERDEILLNSQVGLSTLYSNLKYIETLIKLSETNFKLARN